MLHTFRRDQVIVAAFATSLVLGAPATANAGFLEELFGGAMTQPQPAAPSHEAPVAAPSYGYGQGTYEPRRPRPKKKVVVAKPKDEKPLLQQTTDLMRDPTLHRGDAVMMKNGINIYNGPQASVHNPRQFQPLDRAQHVPASDRTRLAAADTTRNDPLRKEKTAPDSLASGRSASMGTPITQGFKITDARGNSIRYVGP